MELTELVVGLEVLRFVVKISLWIAFQPTGLLTWLHSRFGTTWLWLRKGKGVCFGFIDFHYETTVITATSCVWWTWSTTLQAAHCWRDDIIANSAMRSST
jgi:hypothetical protein